MHEGWGGGEEEKENACHEKAPLARSDSRANRPRRPHLRVPARDEADLELDDDVREVEQVCGEGGRLDQIGLN